MKRMYRREILLIALVAATSGCSTLKSTIRDRNDIGRFSVLSPPWISPTIANGVVIIGRQSRLRGISNELDSEVWQTRVFEIAGKPERTASSVVVTGYSGHAAKIYALNPDDGSIEWERNLGNEQIFPPVRDPCNPETLLVRTISSLHAITTDAQELWTVTELPRETTIKPDLTNELTPNADEDFYYVPSATEAMAIDRKSREIVWHVSVDEPWAPPVPGEDRVFVPAGGDGFIAVEKATGEILWNSKEALRDTPVEIYSSRRRPIVGENAVYANVGEYHVSFSKDGNVNWTADLGDGIHSGPVSFGNANYVSGEHLYEIDKQTGEKRVIIQGLDTPLTPTVSNESLFVSGRKTLYKYGL